jgi:hypothetical protein
MSDALERGVDGDRRPARIEYGNALVERVERPAVKGSLRWASVFARALVNVLRNADSLELS